MHLEQEHCRLLLNFEKIEYSTGFLKTGLL